MAAGSKMAAQGGYADIGRACLRALMSKLYGRVLLAMWGGFVFTSLVGIPMFQSLGGARRGGAGKRSTSARKPAAEANTARGNAVLTILKLLRRHLFTRHGGFFGMYVLTLCTRILITVQLADQGGKLGAYMGSRQWTKMFLGQAMLALWFMSAAGATATMKFLEKRVTLSVREIVYKEILGKYLSSDMRYYHADVPDVASRFTTEIADFSHTAVKTLGHLLKPSIDIIYLSYTIGRRLGTLPLLSFLSFFALGQRMLRSVFSTLPKSLKQLTVEKQALEAALRSSHEQVHLYREQIALQGGTAREHQSLTDLHAKVSDHMVATMYTNAVVDVLQNYVLKYGGAMCGFSVVIPSVWLGDPRRPASEVTAAYLSSTALLSTLAAEMKDLVEAWQDVTKVSGLASRIVGLREALQGLTARPATAHGKADRNALVFKDLTVCTPGDRERPAMVLVKGLSHTVEAGEHLVIRGPNGMGKTSLFRTVCGLWHQAGGDVALPSGGYFAVSQEAYLPCNTSLRGLIAYPGTPSDITTDKAQELLDAVRLTGHAARLDDVGIDWRTLLSGGEKQRLSWARLLHHAPAFAFVDEGTSQVDPAGCDLLHELAKDAGITLVSISHHKAVDAHHTHVLDLHPTVQGQLADIPVVRPLRKDEKTTA